MRLVGSMVVVACIWAGAAGQTIAPVLPAQDELPPTREWTDVLRVTQEKSWDVTLAVRMRFDPKCEEQPGDPASIRDASVSSATFVLPWVRTGSTHRCDEQSVEMRGWLETLSMDQPWVRLHSTSGLQRLGGVSISAPNGQWFDLARGSAADVRHQVNSLRRSGRPLGKGKLPVPAQGSSSGSTTGASTGESSGLCAQFEIQYRATSRRVKLNRDVAGNAVWPDIWPPEAMGAFDKQAYLDLGFEPKTGLVIDLDRDELDDVRSQILKWLNVDDPKRVPPTALAEEVAQVVLNGLVPSGRAQLFVASRLTNGSDAGFADPSIGGEVPPMTGICAGLYVRDVLEIMNSHTANDAERAVALAAIYRRLGLPARVMIAYEAEEDKKEKAARRLAAAFPGGIGKKPEGTGTQSKGTVGLQGGVVKPLTHGLDQPLMWPHLPPFYYERYSIKGHGPVVAGRPNYVGGRRPLSGYVPVNRIQPQIRISPIIAETLRSSARLKRMKFWVEFALYDQERGLAWVPVDCGTGEKNWRFGEVEDSERYVVVATGFWPSQVKRLYVYGSDDHPELDGLVGSFLGRQVWNYSSMPGANFGRTLRMPAAFWGMFTSPDTARVSWQEVGFSATRAVVTGEP